MPKRNPNSARNRTRLIRGYVKQGYSTNEIQRKLQKQHLGMRRQTLLKEVRRAKGQKPKSKAEVAKYVPHKYRVRSRQKRKAPDFGGARQVAGYGSVDGQSRRIQVYGRGRDLYAVMQLILVHPPRKSKPFVTVDAYSLYHDPWEYLSRSDRWDEKPRVRS